MGCSSMAGSMSTIKFPLVNRNPSYLKRQFFQNGPQARDATHDGWTAYMFPYQNQMRNVMNLGRKKMLQGPLAAGLYDKYFVVNLN